MKGIQVDGTKSRIVKSTLDVKHWLERVPDVDVVRPGTCPSCSAAGAQPGKAIGIVGHGLRERQQRGPLVPGGKPALVTVRVRRYLCGCGAILTVVPRETLPRRLYTVSAIASALALFGVERKSLREIRQQISPLIHIGATAVTGWATLRRWIRDIRACRLLPKVRPSPAEFQDRQVAERAAMTAAALAPPGLEGADACVRAFIGAARTG